MLLIRLAAQNLGRRRLRALFLGLAVALSVGVGVASFITGWALSDGIAASFSRMGADLVVVPRGTLVNITASLLTVQPTDETIDGGALAKIAAIEGVARAAPQRQVRTAVEGHPVTLIAIDPATDFTIRTWLREQKQGPIGPGHLLAGGRVPGAVGESMSACGQPMEIYGRLAKTGVGPVDESYFTSFAGLDAMAGCLSDYAPGRFTAILLQLGPAARPEQVKFAISQIPDVKVVEGNGVLTSSRQALRSLFVGIAVFSVLVAIALLILVSLLFSAIVQERTREIGLLRAMGARSGQVVTMVLAEAAMVTGLGGLAGLVLGLAMLLAFARSVGFYFESLGVPFGWPPVPVLAATSLAVVVASAALGVAGALFPAWRVRQRDPFTLIHGEATR